MIPRFIWATPIRMDIFIFRELRNGSSLRLPCHLGSSPKGYVWRTLTKPSVVASLQEAFKDHQEKGEKFFFFFWSLHIWDRDHNSQTLNYIPARDIPASICRAAKQFKWDREELIVDQTGIDGENRHHQNDITAPKGHLRDVSKLLLVIIIFSEIPIKGQWYQEDVKIKCTEM